MSKRDDFLVEIHTEELPPNALLPLAKAFCQQMEGRLQKAQLEFTSAQYYATPCRLAVLVNGLVGAQPDQVIERKGPARQAAFDEKGNPSKACLGFARSVDVEPDALVTIKNKQGEWVGFRQQVPGKSVVELLPDLIEQAVVALPVPKRMCWGEGEIAFARPVHAVILLYGNDIVRSTLFGCETGRVTRGHRFHAPDWVTVPHADTYASLLETEGHVIVDFVKRRDVICEQASHCVQKQLGDDAQVLISSEAFLDEVTGLVEWPVALCGQFDQAFLALPREVLISSMEDHQRYFPVVDTNNKLLPHFVVISNIESHDVKRVVHGNERVLRARLADAAFFYDTDKKIKLEARLEQLKGIVFQAKLGSLYDKAERLAKLAALIASKIGADETQAARAGWLAKTDLTTDMVNEFPELQGVMGAYYARHDGESDAVVTALREHYLPRYANDGLPQLPLGQVVALADKLDTLVGTFGINKLPTGDKDPFGLRRAALGVLRILVEKQINLDLKPVLEAAITYYQKPLENTQTVSQVLHFMQERLRVFCLEKGVTADVFAAVAATGATQPLDVYARIKAVQAFKKLTEAETLSVANKRVSNILTKYEKRIDAKAIDPAFFENAAERVLAEQLEAKSKAVAHLYQSGKYEEALMQLAELRQPIDDFFDQVMVMTDDKSQRENRLLLLGKLRALFLQVADIALLQ